MWMIECKNALLFYYCFINFPQFPTMSRMRHNVGRIPEKQSKVSIGFSIMPTMAENGTRTMSTQQREVVAALKVRCPKMFRPCPTSVREQGEERLYTSIQQMRQQLPKPAQLARVLEGNHLSLCVDVHRSGTHAQSSHFRMTHVDIDNFMAGKPLQLCVLSDVVNGRNNHGKIVFERTRAGEFGHMHYEVGKQQDAKRFTLL